MTTVMTRNLAITMRRYATATYRRYRHPLFDVYYVTLSRKRREGQRVARKSERASADPSVDSSVLVSGRRVDRHRGRNASIVTRFS